MCRLLHQQEEKAVRLAFFHLVGDPVQWWLLGRKAVLGSERPSSQLVGLVVPTIIEEGIEGGSE